MSPRGSCNCVVIVTKTKWCFSSLVTNVLTCQSEIDPLSGKRFGSTDFSWSFRNIPLLYLSRILRLLSYSPNDQMSNLKLLVSGTQRKNHRSMFADQIP